MYDNQFQTVSSFYVREVLSVVGFVLSMHLSTAATAQYPKHSLNVYVFKNTHHFVSLQARMLQELSMATSIHETGHNHINHMTQEIRSACASLPVYAFDIPQNILF